MRRRNEDPLGDEGFGLGDVASLADIFKLKSVAKQKIPNKLLKRLWFIAAVRQSICDLKRM